jgi:hypothetical protein
MLHDDLGGFGDARLRKVGKRLLDAMTEQPSSCLHALADDRNEAIRFGRFLDHDNVSTHEILATAGGYTGSRVFGRHVLAIQDTTEFNFPQHAGKKIGFGRSGNNRDPGFFLHPTIAIDAIDGGVIGVVGAQIINRTHDTIGHLRHRQRPIEDKESYRWLQAMNEASDLLVSAACITMVADRESDLYEQYARCPANIHLLTRASQDRAVLGEERRLFTVMAQWPERHRETITLPAQPGRAARTLTAALRFGSVSLCRPDQLGKKVTSHVDLHAVEVVEINQLANVEPLHWRLLTTHAVTTIAQARQIVSWYRQRWTIEQVFRTLKSAAMRIDQSQVTQARRLIKLAVVGLIAATRIMQIVIGRDGKTKQSILDAVSPEQKPALVAINQSLEGRTALLKNPHQADSLAWFAWIVGRLGGWAGYTSKGYKPPGPKTIARGIAKLDSFIQGWNLAIHSGDT